MNLSSEKSTNQTPLILLVDDNPQNLQLAVSFLKLYNYELTVASGGIEALDIVGHVLPDLILLDIMMPRMDGYEVCRRLKADDRTKDIPVIFLTAKREPEDLIKGFQSGGVDYITKPFRREELIARVSTHIDLKLSKDTIVRKNEELERLSEEKSAILQISAHDLKNPLQGIYGLLSILETQYDSLEATDITEIISSVKNAAETANSIIQDLLEKSALEEGKMTFKAEKTDLKSIVSGVFEEYRQRAEAKGQNLIFTSDEKEFSALIDPGKFERVAVNLVSNAIKFSPSGKSIKMKLYTTTNIRGTETIVFEVKDEGPGIKKSEFSKLFTSFGKLSARPTAGEPSTGLGLSIVKRIVEAMNGKVWCESEEGRYTSFYVEFETAKL